MQSINHLIEINNLEKTVNEICKFIQDEISNKLQKKGVVFGLSGGIDSAVTSTLCAMTGKPTIVLSMPIHQSKLQLNRANNHLEWLKSKYPNVRVLEFDLSILFETSTANTMSTPSLFTVPNCVPILGLANPMKAK